MSVRQNVVLCHVILQTYVYALNVHDLLHQVPLGLPSTASRPRSINPFNLCNSFCSYQTKSRLAILPRSGNDQTFSSSSSSISPVFVPNSQTPLCPFCAC